MEHILIIDDDVELCDMLGKYLSPRGMCVSVEHCAQTGMEAMRNGTFDLTVLDVMLPGLDGFSVLRSVRTWSDARILLLTARGDRDDCVKGFELGADDYLPKPFHPPELVARIRAILRRKCVVDDPGPECLTAGNVLVNLRSRSVSVDAELLDLTAAEFDLLAAFIESPGKILSRDWLVQRAFSRSFNPEDRSLDMHVSRLRRKLDAADVTQTRIVTVRSAGYLFSVST